MQKYLRAFILLLAVFACSPWASAQRVALKTNVIDWLTLSPNLTLEGRLSRHWSLQFGVATNPTHIKIADFQSTNFRVEPELRYWFNRPMARHFLGLSATAALYNMHGKKHVYTGDAVGFGLSYGYAVVISDHWNFEAELGLGIANFSGKRYPTGEKAPAQKNWNTWQPVPIRLGVTFAYVFK